MDMITDKGTPMAKSSGVGSKHVWRWRDEDPEVIVLLVLILVAIIAVPWRGCAPALTQGKPHSLLEVAKTSIEGVATPGTQNH